MSDQLSSPFSSYIHLCLSLSSSVTSLTIHPPTSFPCLCVCVRYANGCNTTFSSITHAVSNVSVLINFLLTLSSSHLSVLLQWLPLLPIAWLLLSLAVPRLYVWWLLHSCLPLPMLPCSEPITQTLLIILSCTPPAQQYAWCSCWVQLGMRHLRIVVDCMIMPFPPSGNCNPSALCAHPYNIFGVDAHVGACSMPDPLFISPQFLYISVFSHSLYSPCSLFTPGLFTSEHQYVMCIVLLWYRLESSCSPKCLPLHLLPTYIMFHIINRHGCTYITVRNGPYSRYPHFGYIGRCKCNDTDD